MGAIAEDQKPKIHAQLERILSSNTFSGSERHRKFLQFVVEQALKGDTDKLNEFVLGFEVFNKSESFDPRIDSIVRVEARRLRERLKKYYDDEGRSDGLVITLRPRSFVPDFQEQSPADAAKPGRTWRLKWLPSHRTAALIIAAGLVGAGITAAYLTFRSRRWQPPQSASILVLPFHGFSSSPSQELLGDAIADALITGLAGSPGLRVISRGSGIQFQESGRAPYQFAADLKVDYIVEGTVKAEGDVVRVSAKMTDVHGQSYVWADTREIKLAALPEVEREWTDAVSSHIRIPLPPDSGEKVTRRRAGNWQAYSAFLKGQYYWYQQGPDNAQKSIQLFEEAIHGDPNYAPAWAWLSQSYQLVIMGDDGRDPSLVIKGRQAAQKSLALDDQLAEAHAAVASFDALDWDWDNADREFRRAIELNSEWAQGHLMYSLMYLVPTGQRAAAVGEMLRAHELDPLTKTTRALLAEVLYLNRDYARAIAELADLRNPAGAPSFDDWRYFLSLSLSGQGDKAVAEMGRIDYGNPEPLVVLAMKAYLFARHGDRAKAEAERRALLKRTTTEYVPPLALAMVSVGMGDKDDAFLQLRTAVSRHLPSVPQAVSDPIFDPLRSDSRYAEILHSIGLKRNN